MGKKGKSKPKPRWNAHLKSTWRRGTNFNVRTGELYLAVLTCSHHFRNVDPTVALV